VLRRLGEKSAVLSSKRRPGARAVVGGGPSRARCTRRRRPRWGKRFCGRADRDDKGENLRAISVRGLPATGSPPLDLEKEGGRAEAEREEVGATAPGKRGGRGWANGRRRRVD
jgi:hypothetical protein